MFTVRSLSSGEFLYNNGNRVTWRPSPHVNSGFSGGNKRRFLVMHYTGGSSGNSSVDWFENPTSRVSAHITIDRDGTVWQSVSLSDRAWHCGASS